MFQDYAAALIRERWSKWFGIQEEAGEQKINARGVDMLAEELSRILGQPLPLVHRHVLEIAANEPSPSLTVSNNTDSGTALSIPQGIINIGPDASLEAVHWAKATADSVNATGNRSYVDVIPVGDKDGSQLDMVRLGGDPSLGLVPASTASIRVCLPGTANRAVRVLRNDVIPYCYDNNGMAVSWAGAYVEPVDRVEFSLKRPLTTGDDYATCVTVLDWMPREQPFPYSTITVKNWERAFAGVTSSVGMAERYYVNFSSRTAAYQISRLRSPPPDTEVVGGIAPSCAECDGCSFCSNSFQIWTMQVVLSGFTNGSCSSASQWNGTYVLNHDTGSSCTWSLGGLHIDFDNPNCGLSLLKLTASSNLMRLQGMNSAGTILFAYTDTRTTPFDCEAVTSHPFDTLVTSPATVITPPATATLMTWGPSPVGYNADGGCPKCSDGLWPIQVQAVISGVMTSSSSACYSCEEYNGTWILDQAFTNSGGCYMEKSLGVFACPAPNNGPKLINWTQSNSEVWLFGQRWNRYFRRTRSTPAECMNIPALSIANAFNPSDYCLAQGATVEVTIVE